MMNVKQWLSEYQIAAPDIDVDTLVIDSRDVSLHSVFVAVKGHSLDGRDFIPQAISLGAPVVVQQTEDRTLHGSVEMREQTVIISFYQLAQQLSDLAACFYRYPANQVDVIAVTGTNGKTSTVQLISQLRTLLGDKAASIGTLGAGVFDQRHPQALQTTRNTTPDACQIQGLLANYRDNGAKQVALEASSHALVQDRISGLKTDVAIFTNLTHDHLDYHKTMTAYGAAKRLLLKQPELKHVVINLNDPESKNWLANTLPGQHITVYGVNVTAPQNTQFCIAKNVRCSNAGLRFTLISSWGEADVSSTLIGEFNVLNLLAAISGLLTLQLPFNDVINVCAALKPVAGRMELYQQADNASVIVDYAHTPDALEKALGAARAHCHGQLICVFGCGGDRDQEKRPVMGSVAQALSDKLVLTSDNSRHESTADIIDDILVGISARDNVMCEYDRKQAIRAALAWSQPEDVIVVAGKGHETTQNIGGTDFPYDERKFVQSLITGNQT